MQYLRSKDGNENWVKHRASRTKIRVCCRHSTPPSNEHPPLRTWTSNRLWRKCSSERSSKKGLPRNNNVAFLATTTMQTSSRRLRYLQHDPSAGVNLRKTPLAVHKVEDDCPENFQQLCVSDLRHITSIRPASNSRVSGDDKRYDIFECKWIQKAQKAKETDDTLVQDMRENL